jgi:YegS/Rv2252/BmrU family lipid kinase
MYFVVNPAAGRGRGRKTLDRLQPLLRPDDVVAVSEGPGHCQRLAAEGAAQYPAVTVVGGDGTLCEVINGIADAGFTAALGILPVGTANDLATGLGIPRDFDVALAIVRAGNVHPVDLGLIVRPPKAERYFVTTVGAGINALIASQAQAETDKAVGSPIVYIGAAIRGIFRYSPVPMEIEAGEFVFRGPILMMSVSNVAKEGGLFWLAPNARPDDGFLHLLIWSDVPLWLRHWYALKSVLGGTHKLKRASLRAVKSVTLRAVEDTPFYVDGEYSPLRAGESVEMTVQEGKLGVLAPPR